MSIFNRTLFAIKKKKNKSMTSTTMAGVGPYQQQPQYSRALAVQVGELLAFMIVLGELLLTIYCIVRGRTGQLSTDEFEVYKQYNWFAVSVAAGLAVNGAMGKFTYYSGGSYQSGSTVPQPGIGSTTTPNIMPGTGIQDPWMVPSAPQNGLGTVMNLEDDVSMAMANENQPVNLAAAGQDDNPETKVDVHGRMS